MTRVVNVRLLKDGTNRVCIHWLQEVKDGPIRYECDSQFRRNSGQSTQVVARIACRPEQTTIFPQQRGAEQLLCVHSSEIRAVTCPDCLATPAAVEALQESHERIDPLAGAIAAEAERQAASVAV